MDLRALAVPRHGTPEWEIDMGRYVYEYQGTFGVATPPQGLDPNYRGGYHGGRTVANATEAAYGTYRDIHLPELGPAYPAPELPRPEPVTPLLTW